MKNIYIKFNNKEELEVACKEIRKLGYHHQFGDIVFKGGGMLKGQDNGMFYISNRSEKENKDRGYAEHKIGKLKVTDLGKDEAIKFKNAKGDYASNGDYSLLGKRELDNYKKEMGIGKTKKEIETEKGLTNAAVPGGLYKQYTTIGIDTCGTTPLQEGKAQTDYTDVSSNVIRSKVGADLLAESAKEQMQRYFPHTKTNPLHNLFQ